MQACAWALLLPSSSVDEIAVSSFASACPCGILKAEPLPRKELDDLKEQLDRVPKDTDRLRLVRRVGINYTLNCAELKELTHVMRYGQAAVDFVVMMYPKLRDKEGINDVINSFQYAEDKQQIRTKLALPQ